MAIATYWPLAFGLVLIAGFGAWVFIHSNRSYLLRWVMIPLALGVSVVSAKVYDARLGYAVSAELPVKFVYLGHQVIVERNRKTGIEVWAKSAGTRLYRIAYSRSAEGAMDVAREQAKAGQPVVMQRRQASAAKTSSQLASTQQSNDEPMYESRIVLPSDVDPKR